jgi:hypothetical protein
MSSIKKLIKKNPKKYKVGKHTNSLYIDKKEAEKDFQLVKEYLKKLRKEDE